jgi:hypothetical protein
LAFPSTYACTIYLEVNHVGNLYGARCEEAFVVLNVLNRENCNLFLSNEAENELNGWMDEADGFSQIHRYP